MGRFAGVASPARTYTPLVGAELTLPAGAQASIPLDTTFEHGLLALSSGIGVEGDPVTRGAMVVIDAGRSEVRVSAGQPGTVLLIGGEPFDEELVMWWNFVGRTHEELVEARSDWEAGRHFGVVNGYNGARLAAPVSQWEALGVADLEQDGPQHHGHRLSRDVTPGGRCRDVTHPGRHRPER